MASPSFLQSSFQCSICLDAFTDPVSTPCGHNFCKVCIDSHWDISNDFQCPLCQEGFERRPHLRVNVVLRDLVNQFNQVNIEDVDEEKGPTKPQEVLCDVCTGDKKVKALKSCLHCEQSLCDEHLKPHQNDAELRRHELLDPVMKLRESVCKQHMKPLALVCQSDLTCVCILCIKSDHEHHKCVPLEGRLKRIKIKVDQALTEVHQKIKERKEIVEKGTQSVEIYKKNASTDLEDIQRLFSNLHQVIALSQIGLIGTINCVLSKSENRSQSIIEEQEQEISELERRRVELEHLSHTKDHLHLLQSVPALQACDPLPTKDWSEVSVYSDPCVGTVRCAVKLLLTTLRIGVDLEMERLVENEIKRIQQYAVDVTLDPDTANSLLILSEDGKQVRQGTMLQSLPDNPERFDSLLCVLGKQGYASGAFYFEVQVKGKSSWDIGVALETVDRKGLPVVNLSHGYCVLMRRHKEFIACNESAISMNLSKMPQTVGVFVDYEVGEVAFYDVGNKLHIYSYVGMQFPKKLHPYFNTCTAENGSNSAPLIVNPVS
ncbi:E3 ubiquitin-protein ligase TRIM11-like [Polymixia lowei]